jgi:Cu+-exporting ATPase
LSQAIVQKAKELKYEIEEPKDTKTVPGMGIYGSVAGRTVHVGNSKLMKKAGVDAAMTEK